MILSPLLFFVYPWSPCLREVRTPSPHFLISWFKTPMVLPRFYASVRNTATPYSLHRVGSFYRHLALVQNGALLATDYESVGIRIGATIPDPSISNNNSI